MIELKGVGMSYGSFEALKPTSVTLHEGDFTVLLGTSGAGKSTILRTINMLNNPTCGEVSIQGFGTLENNSRSLRRVRREVAMVFQQHQLIPRYTALQNTLVGSLGRYSSMRTLWPMSIEEKRHALDCLDRVGLLHKANERVDNLSGGQQQRVGIARALAQKPKIILADEPVASLDPVTSEKVLSILHRVCREGDLTAVVSLHQLELAQKFADRVVGLKEGAIAFDGCVDELSESHLTMIYNEPVELSRVDREQAIEAGLTLATEQV